MRVVIFHYKTPTGVFFMIHRSFLNPDYVIYLYRNAIKFIFKIDLLKISSNKNILSNINHITSATDPFTISHEKLHEVPHTTFHKSVKATLQRATLLISQKG